MLRPIRTWFTALRPVSFTASIVPVLVGTAIAARDVYHPLLFVLAMAGSVAIHAGTNLVNDYFDHVKGTDGPDALGPSGVIQRGMLSPRAVLAGGIVAFAAGGAIGLAITAMTGWPVLALGVASVLAGYFYTASPFSLAYRGLGEIVVFVFMGPVIVVGAFYVQTQAWGWQPFVASVPVGLLVAAILHANNIRDIEGDRRNHKWTLAALAGRPLADYEYGALMLGGYAVVVAMTVTGAAPWPVLVTLLSLPLALRLIRFERSQREARGLNVVLAQTAGMHMLFGGLLAFGFAVAVWTGVV
ncbi:MAG TPA: 1,4-dihydroxy-2-naphthoate octaprenyltransferase [Dehalococcoidia bacterium]|nr:1,4-dihydroxy-2-naphthoate octaprenyltransferase [Dehalococcoidia bacterium]